MDSLNSIVIPLSQASKTDEKLIGGKAAKLAKLVQAGYRIPAGFCITVFAYQQFIQANRIDEKIKFELGRKPFESMRWEEIWDAALRIRSVFQTAKIPDEIKNQIIRSFEKLGVGKKLVVRSSAPKEDSAKASFAGLHESYVGVEREKGLLNAVRLVWASLWSDAALLYQHELGLDPLHSSMAIVVQQLVEEEISGVAFGVDPRNPKEDRAIIEAVPGLCQDLVDGVVDPDRWILKRTTGKVIEMKPGKREESKSLTPILQNDNLEQIYKTLQGIENLFDWYPDTEWTGKGDRFTLLQARPVTTSKSKPKDEKAYYLTLRPGEKRLKILAKKVADELIPQLEAEGETLAAEELSQMNDYELAETIEHREQLLKKWKKIYWDDFIPFAHGVRHLATYYNDAVQPNDAYEFVGLLKGQSMISTKRNQKMIELAGHIKKQSNLMHNLQKVITGNMQESDFWEDLTRHIGNQPGAKKFLVSFQKLLDEYMDVSFGKERLKNQPALILKNVLEIAKDPRQSIFQRSISKEKKTINQLEQKLFDAVGPSRQEEAKDVLRIGRLSWRLRDDDNLLLGRVESQLLRAMNIGAERLSKSGRLKSKVEMIPKFAANIAAALQNPESGFVDLPTQEIKVTNKIKKRADVKPRQLLGQPAAGGVVSGKVRIIRSSEDLGKFEAGEILVCDAIQPNMTHLVPLSSAIIERRGGMLIHGAIIAREMGIPCVNGIPDAAEILQNGELVTVDGYLGIVTVGAAEFDLETKF